ncbi:MAG: flagellar basal body P-ring protein FlgI [Planctomycetaceae bacterium]
MKKVLVALGCLLPLIAGCNTFWSKEGFELPFAEKKEDRVIKNVQSALKGEEGHSRLVGDYITVRSGLQMYVVEGVGLVKGLNGTGGDPGPPYRDVILEDMRKRRFPQPEQFLRLPSTTVVIVRAYVPPLVRKGDLIDVEIRVPEGSDTTSLQGGYLLECSLSEQAYAQGRGMLEGRAVAKAEGPILNLQLDSSSDNGQFLRGIIPGGAVYTGEHRKLSVQLKGDYTNYRMSTRIADRIGTRFFDYDDDGIQRKLAEAKTHSKIELDVHSRYRDNYPRYLQTIRHIELKDTSASRHQRLQELALELRNPAQAEQAALRMEAIGVEAIPFLKSALTSTTGEPPLPIECRFHAAQSLAYLGDTAGVNTLVEAARTEPAFRVFALAALSATMSPEAVVGLRELFDEESIETRYGAFRAITTIMPYETSVAGAEMKGGYTLHPVQTEASPFVHFTKRRKREIVIFGPQQEFLTPVIIKAGQGITVRSNPEGTGMIISHIASDGSPQRLETSLRIGDVITKVDALGARYPDVVQMLVEAEKQGNLPGPLGIDALPQPGRVMRSEQEVTDSNDSSDSPKQAGEFDSTPNLFDNSDHSKRATETPETPEDNLTSPDVPTESLDDPVGFTVN